jgi:hypothetical protein
LKTFLKPTKLTSVALSFINFTVAVRNTGVDALILNSSLEEAFAAFAGDNAIMQPSGLVLADHADHGLVVLLDHPVGWLVVVAVEVRFTGLCVGWQLLNVPFPQLRHVYGPSVPAPHAWLGQGLQAGQICGDIGEPGEHRPVAGDAIDP